MKNLLFLALLAFTCVGRVSAQTPTPTATPPDDGDIVKISTNLIQLDVTVTDSGGRVVRDLKPEDFEVYENGEKQKITNFSFVSRVSEKTQVPVKTDKNLPIPIPQAALRSEQVKRTIALVVDDLSLSFESAYSVRRALRKFVDEQMLDGDLVAIIRTGAGIGALQQFTSDKRQLYAAIEKVVWNPMGRGNIGAFATINDSSLVSNEEASEEDQLARENSENALEDFRSATFATGTLGALRFIVNGMSELPGRKSVILFSDGFRLLERDEQGFQGRGRVLDFLNQLIETANRASVVFYTIDGRGLQSTGITAADSVNPTPERIQQVLSERSNELFETQAGLSYLARQTGGFAVINNNDLAGGVQRVLDDQSYYLIGYEPDTDTFDAKTRRFNKLEIKVRTKGVNVRYRSGFFNFADRETPIAAKNLTPQQQIEKALVSPFGVNDISLRLNSLVGNSAALGTFVRPLLHINARDLEFESLPDGSKQSVFTVLAMLFGDNGAVVDQIAKSYTMTLPDDVFQQIIRTGFVYHFSIPLKRAGAYQMRVALRDSKAGRVGSASQFIEVPNLKKERLTISGIVLENLTDAQWKVLDSVAPAAVKPGEALPERPNPMNDTSLRRFKKGTILRYGFEIYNAKLDSSKKPNLTSQIRVFYEGKLLLNGQKIPVDVAGQTDLERVKASGALSLSGAMKPGDYILQIIVYDGLAKQKRQISTQFVQFEVTN